MTSQSTISSFNEIKTDHLTSHSLVIFDIDETLITPTDALLKPIGGSCQAWQRIPPERFEQYLSLMFANTEYALVDEAAPTFLKSLHQKGISTLGLTACSTGGVGVISSMIQWRSDQLKRLGIAFESKVQEKWIFSELVEPKSLHPPLFNDSILFTGDLQHPEKSSKGLLLDAFLDRIKKKYDQIIFIDDQIKHLGAVEKIAHVREIPFRGYLFQGPIHQLNEKIAEFQIQTLLESERWIPARLV